MAYCYAEMGMVDTFIEIYERILTKDKATRSDCSAYFYLLNLGSAFHERLKKYSKFYWELRTQSRTISLWQKTRLSRVGMQAHFFATKSSSLKEKADRLITGDLGIHVVSTFLALLVKLFQGFVAC